DHFDPEGAIELLALLKDKFPQNAQLLEYDFKANYAIERFEEAAAALEQLEQITQADLTSYKERFATTMDKYQQELMIRRQEAETNDLPRVRLMTTEGNIVIELFENHAPNTVANFIHLVRDQKFYDGKLFHLVKPGEYAMTGSPTGDGMGDAGYRIKCECYQEKIRSHFRGTLSMMAPNKDQGGSQFFITQQPNPHTYDGKYTAFGRVVEGMDVVLKLQSIDLSGRLASVDNVSKIMKAEVLRARSHPYMPEKIANNSFLPGNTSGLGGNNAATQGTDSDVDAAGSFDLLLQGGDGGK
ncbi:MAG: peptidylprolyl isomerase, partial [Planctomycetota bacterium]